MTDRVSRRDFFKLGMAGFLSTPFSFWGNEQKQNKRWSPSHQMQYRILGQRTGLRVSEVGIGGYPIDDPDVIYYALDKGINYIDTAEDYRDGRSEIAIGKAMRGVRQRVVLTTKWHPWAKTKKSEMLASLDTSLKRLQTDHVDCLLVHQVGRASGGEALERLQNPELYEAYRLAKQQGKVRFAGVSGHDGDLMEVMNWVIDHGFFDVILMRYNFLVFPEQQALIKRAKDKGLGVIAMKTLAGAKGQNDVKLYRSSGASFKQAALKWVLSNPDISNLIISISNRAQIDEYAPVSGSTLTEADRELLHYYVEAYGREACTFCNRCESYCPQQVHIANILRYYMYAENYGDVDRGRSAFLALSPENRIDGCEGCPAPCLQSCPTGVDIPGELTKAHALLGAREPLG